MHGTKKVGPSDVLSYYEQPEIISHYEQAARKIGLWESESIVVKKCFSLLGSCLLDLGCGCGRITFGLRKLGYDRVVASDFSPAMIKRSRILAKSMGIEQSFEVADARALPYDDATFQGVVFGFNGLMQIPGRENRMQAMREIHRSLKPGGIFVFTTHDRSMPKWKKFWETERLLWRKARANPFLRDFGDRFERTESGNLYMHVPSIQEVKRELNECGFQLSWEKMRSRISTESEEVNEYSDDCRFWMARKS